MMNDDGALARAQVMMCLADDDDDGIALHHNAR